MSESTTLSLADDIGAGLRWTAIANIAGRVIGALRVVLLARIVGPHSFGVFSAAFAVASIGSLVAEFGLRPYLIHRGERAAVEFRVVSRLAVLAATLAAFAVAAASPWIANLYHEAAAEGVVLALAGWVLIGGLGVAAQALIRAQRRFRAAALLQLVAELGGTLAGLATAFFGARLWALPVSLLASQAISTSVGRFLVRGRESAALPINERRAVRTRALRYGSAVTTGALVWAAALQGDNITVGQIAGTTALGFYALAYNYGIVPGSFVGSTVSDVALVHFAGASRDEDRRDLFLRFARIGAAVSSPLVALALALASPSVEVLLGHQWQQSVPALQVMLVVGWIRGLVPTESLLRSMGRVFVEARFGIVAAPLTILAAAVGARSSVFLAALLVGAVLTAVGLAVLAVALRGIRLSPARVGRAVAPAIALSGLAALATTGLARALDASDAVQLFVLGPLALLSFIGLLRRFLPLDWKELRVVFRSTPTRTPTPEGTGREPTVVVLAHFGWNVPFMQFHKRLWAKVAARNFEVLWVDERLRVATGLMRWISAIPNGLVSRDEGLWRLQPWTVPGERFGKLLPLPQWLVARATRKTLARHQRGCDIVVSFTPMENSTVRSLKPAALVYWTGDEVTMPHEEWLVREADLVLAVSDLARAQKEPLAPGRVHRVSTGVEVERFAVVLENPPELAALARPIFGYVGALSARRIDVDCIRAAAVANAAGSVVLIGKEDSAFLDEASLPANVVRFGERPFGDIPAYIASFDVGLVPYLVNNFNAGSDPLKAHEYLAAGVPVVATDLPAFHSYDGLVSIASAANFGRVATALAPERHDDEKVRARRAAAASHGIDVIADAIVAMLQDLNLDQRKTR